MVDYESDLQSDIPGIDVQATVGLQWISGVALATTLHAEHRLSSTVIIGLGTNGPVTPTDMTAMERALGFARKIIFVTVHVDRPWQDTTNATLRTGAANNPRTVIADWARLADGHPGWFYSDGTHLPIGGTGAKALAALVARTVRGA